MTNKTIKSKWGRIETGTFVKIGEQFLKIKLTESSGKLTLNINEYWASRQNWNDGKRKTIAQQFFKTLEKAGLIELPPLEVNKQRRPAELKITEIQIETPISSNLKEIEPSYLEIARAGKDLKRWRQYVNEYHMLGDKKVFGSRLAYFIKSGNML